MKPLPRLAHFLHSLLLISAALLAVPASVARAEPGVTDKALLIGQSAALTGPAQALGQEMRLGAQLYFDQVNASGGIHGRKLQLISLDDGYEPERAAANTRKLIDEDKVLALFAYVGTPTSAAALPLFSEARVPFIGAFTGAELLRTPFNRYVFNVRASYFDETEKIVEHLTTTGIRRIAVFYQNDAYGKAGLAGMERALGKRKLAIAASATVERNAVEVAAASRSIHAANPDAVVMISAYKSVATFVRVMKAAGSTAQFHNVSFVGSKPLATELGADGIGVAVTQVVPFPWSGMLPVTREYAELMKKAGQSDLSFTSLEGYIAARVLVEGLRRAGREVSREKLVAALEGMSNTDIGGFNINFSPSNHNGSTLVDLTIIGKNGKFMR
jgi:ABC-type branched-subunit amino acid transport system substrate-binding protein